MHIFASPADLGQANAELPTSASSPQSEPPVVNCRPNINEVAFGRTAGRPAVAPGWAACLTDLLPHNEALDRPNARKVRPHLEPTPMRTHSARCGDALGDADQRLDGARDEHRLRLRLDLRGCARTMRAYGRLSDGMHRPWPLPYSRTLAHRNVVAQRSRQASWAQHPERPHRWVAGARAAIAVRRLCQVRLTTTTRPHQGWHTERLYTCHRMSPSSVAGRIGTPSWTVDKRGALASYAPVWANSGFLAASARALHTSGPTSSIEKQATHCFDQSFPLAIGDQGSRGTPATTAKPNHDAPQSAASGRIRRRASTGKLTCVPPPLDHPSRPPPKEATVPKMSSAASRCSDSTDSQQNQCQAWPFRVVAAIPGTDSGEKLHGATRRNRPCKSGLSQGHTSLHEKPPTRGGGCGQGRRQKRRLAKLC